MMERVFEEKIVCTLSVDDYNFKKEFYRDTNTPVWEVYPDKWEELMRRIKEEEEKERRIKEVMMGDFVEDINILWKEGLEEVKVGSDVILKFGGNFVYWDELGYYVNGMKKTDSRLVVDIINYYRLRDINYLLKIKELNSVVVWADYYEEFSEGGAVDQDKYPFNRHRSWRRSSRRVYTRSLKISKTT